MKDEEAIINKYKHQEHTPLFLLEGGRIVIGEKVDEENRLWYVIMDGEQIVLEQALNQAVVQILKKPDVKITHHTTTTPSSIKQMEKGK